MARFLQRGNVADATVVVTPSADNIVTGVFGRGAVQWFINSGTFTVPSGVTAVRARMWGAGGQIGGGGGGFAIKIITGLTPGDTVPVTVGGAPAGFGAGGTSSFGAFVSATGGAGGGAGVQPGGVGVGGDFNAMGGSGNASSGVGTFAGGAAGVFGDGGTGWSPGNAGGAFVNNGTGGMSGRGTSGSGEYGDPGIVTALDFIGTGGGGGAAGANGGGGGSGGFPGGGAISSSGNNRAGNGLVIVEW